MGRNDIRASLTSADALHLLVLFVLVCLSPLAIARTDAEWWLPTGYVSLAFAILVLARAEGRHPGNGFVRFVHFWYPVAAVLLIFWSLYWIVPAVNQGEFRDDLLYQWDKDVLGFDPVEWFRGLERPWLTDVLHVIYMSYFVLPVILVLVLIRRGNKEALAETIFVLCLSFYLCYVGYGVLKAGGPRHFIYHSNEMEGLWVTQWLRDLIDGLEPNKADAFPSAHTAATLVVNVLALRHIRRVGLWMLPLTAAILFSLVYARYHWFADIVAGFVWAFVTVAAGIPLHALWERKARCRAT
jgi:membrane-associated phospholipid phosphatase